MSKIAERIADAIREYLQEPSNQVVRLEVERLWSADVDVWELEESSKYIDVNDFVITAQFVETLKKLEYGQ